MMAASSMVGETACRYAIVILVPSWPSTSAMRSSGTPVRVSGRANRDTAPDVMS